MTLHMTRSVYEQIRHSIGSLPSEQGGMLGTSDGKTIDTFCFDRGAHRGCATYAPTTAFFDETLNGPWKEKGIQFAGIVHSHPFGCTGPSEADYLYAQRIMKAFDLEYFFMPIVQSGHEGSFRIYPYLEKASRKGFDLNEIEMQIDDVAYDPEASETPFSRLEGVLDLDLLAKSTIIGIGCGGARGFYLDMARMGVGNFVLMDGDDVSVANIASQGVRFSEVGSPKVEAIAQELIEINPDINVVQIPRFLDDKFSDDELKAIEAQLPDQNQIVLCGLTDDFFAEDRSALLALKFQLPYLSGGHFNGGVGSELLYWYPGVSKACPRCLLESRYEAVLKKDYVSDISSNNAPIFVSTRLNALREKVALGMLLYRKHPHSAYCTFLSRHPERNYAIIRHDEDLPTALNLTKEFASTDARFEDDVVWLDYQALKGDFHCPDCHDQQDPKAIAEGIANTLDVAVKDPTKGD